MDADFYEINASTSGTKELKEIIDKCKTSFFGLQQKTSYVYVDEFHRWNKLQQDSLLQWLEEGVIRFIGSTTENPYFAVNNAVISRVRSMYEFHRHEKRHIVAILKRAMEDEERGLGRRSLSWDMEALEMIADRCNGDARMALDTLGFIADNLSPGGRINLAMVGEATQSQTTFYDKSEDKYNLLSALQKSIRGSDPDAVVHYLAKLLVAGDLLSPCRRLLVIAAEDIGLAYPQAIPIVKACVDSALQIGLPEARLPLADAAILLATAPKSNTGHDAIIAAMADVQNGKTGDVPRHLQNVHADSTGSGPHASYKYPHVYPNRWVDQQYLPDAVKDAHYYEYGDNKTEQAAKRYWDEIKKK